MYHNNWYLDNKCKMMVIINGKVINDTTERDQDDYVISGLFLLANIYDNQQRNLQFYLLFQFTKYYKAPTYPITTVVAQFFNSINNFLQLIEQQIWLNQLFPSILLQKQSLAIYRVHAYIYYKIYNITKHSFEIFAILYILFYNAMSTSIYILVKGKRVM